MPHCFHPLVEVRRQLSGILGSTALQGIDPQVVEYLHFAAGSSDSSMCSTLLARSADPSNPGEEVGCRENKPVITYRAVFGGAPSRHRAVYPKVNGREWEEAMDTNTRNGWVLIGSTVAGAVGGGMAAPRMGAVLGAAAGPWGVAAGVVLGALAGASVASIIVGDVDFPSPERKRAQRGCAVAVKLV